MTEKNPWEKTGETYEVWKARMLKPKSNYETLAELSRDLLEFARVVFVIVGMMSAFGGGVAICRALWLLAGSVV